MISGRLRLEKIDVLKPIVIVNEFGSQETTYEHRFTTRCEVVRTSGSREVDNNDMFYGERKTFSIRYYHPIENFDIIIWKDKRYRILDIDKNRDQQRIIIQTELINE